MEGNGNIPSSDYHSKQSLVPSSTQYGYRLPETDDNVNFYQIKFGPFGRKCFTYPEMCLRPRELQWVSRVDPKPILRTFVIELQNRFSTVCGAPLQLQTKAKFTVIDLLSSTQAEANAHPNLTSKMYGSRPAIYRSKTEVEQMLTQQKIITSSVPRFTQQASTAATPASILRDPGSAASASNKSQSASTITGVSNKQNISSANGTASKEVTLNSVLRGQVTAGIATSSPSNITGMSSKWNISGPNANREQCQSSDVTSAIEQSGQIQLPGTSMSTSQKQVIYMSQMSSLQVTPKPLGFVSGQTVSRGFGGPISATPFSQPVIDTSAANNGSSGDTDSSQSSIIPGTQQSVARKLFPTFKPKKTPVQVAAPVITKTTSKVVPMFSSHKKPSSRRSSTGQGGMNEQPSRPFSIIMGLASSQNTSASSSTFGSFSQKPPTSPFKFSTGHGSLSSHNSLVAPSFQKSTTTFQKAVQCFQKTPSSISKPGAGMLMGNTAKKSEGGKSKTQDSKSEKPKKRQKVGKKPESAESKKAKKLKKAET